MAAVDAGATAENQPLTGAGLSETGPGPDEAPPAATNAAVPATNTDLELRLRQEMRAGEARLSAQLKAQKEVITSLHSKLDAVTCKQCQGFFDAAGGILPPGTALQCLHDCSRHRVQHQAAPGTQSSYWDMSFPEDRSDGGAPAVAGEARE